MILKKKTIRGKHYLISATGAVKHGPFSGDAEIEKFLAKKENVAKKKAAKKEEANKIAIEKEVLEDAKDGRLTKESKEKVKKALNKK